MCHDLVNGKDNQYRPAISSSIRMHHVFHLPVLCFQSLQRVDIPSNFHPLSMGPRKKRLEQTYSLKHSYSRQPHNCYRLCCWDFTCICCFCYMVIVNQSTQIYEPYCIFFVWPTTKECCEKPRNTIKLYNIFYNVPPIPDRVKCTPMEQS